MDLIRAEIYRCFVDPQIPEAEKGQPGFVGLVPLPADVVQLTPCRAIVGCIEVAAAVQDLSCGQTQPLARMRIHFKCHVPGHVLAEVKHPLTLRGVEGAAGIDGLLLSDLRSFLLDEDVLRIDAGLRALILHRQSHIHVFPYENAAQGHCAF